MLGQAALTQVSLTENAQAIWLVLPMRNRAHVRANDFRGFRLRPVLPTTLVGIGNSYLFFCGWLSFSVLHFLSLAQFGLLGDIDWIVLSPEAIQEISDLGNQEISALLKQDLRKLDSKMRTDAKPN